jgi:tRNA-specific 2-thiouridylase
MTKKKIAVAMSGGVDSAVAAYLLAREGHEVFGVTLKLYCYGEDDVATERSCCSLSAIQDARATCDVVGIPHYVLNFEDRFAEKVIDRFVDDYLSGDTPNPCVLCNQHVKFGALLEKARAFGADWIATGHYARLEQASDGPMLTRGVDPDKDQSYALWAVPRGVYRHTLMPVGHHTKDEIRAFARDGGLPVAGKIDSQDICFVPRGGYDEFVEKRADRSMGLAAALKEGPIVDTSNREVGRHRGIARYTVGQRRGIGVVAADPLYVVAIRARTNTLVVGTADELFAPGFTADEVNWVSVDGVANPRPITAKIRYRHAGSPATLVPVPDGTVRVVFDEPQRAVTGGQSAVFYDGDTVIGGGVIRSVLTPDEAGQPSTLSVSEP